MRPISVGIVLTPEVKTTVYTVPVGYYAMWNLSYAVNHTGQNKYIDIIVYSSRYAKIFEPELILNESSAEF